MFSILRFFSNFIFIVLSKIFFSKFWNFSNFYNSEFRCKTEGNELLRLDKTCPNFANIGNNLIKEIIYSDKIGKIFSTSVFDKKIINVKTITTKINSKAEAGIAPIKFIFLLEFSKISTLLVNFCKTLSSFLEIYISLSEFKLCKIHFISKFFACKRSSPIFLSFL